MAFISSGTTILDNGAFSVGLGGLVLLSEQTASASASISFTSGIDSTYDVYYFQFINHHPENKFGSGNLQFQTSIDSGSNYNVTLTSTWFRAGHNEVDTETFLQYQSDEDKAQSTTFQNLASGVDNDNDASLCGTLYLFNPSSTTYVKHFIATTQVSHSDPASNNCFIAGYFNTTSAINAIKFKAQSGNIDAGTIKMYGIKGS